MLSNGDSLSHSPRPDGKTGEPWLVPAGVHEVVVPSGREVAAKPGTLFSEVAAQGIYKLIGPGNLETMRAVNLADLTTSDFENVPPLKIETAKTAATPEAINEQAPLTAYLLAAILALLALEALLLYRRRRILLEA